MNLTPATSHGKLDEKQRRALISLLADDDQNVYRTVRQKIISYGPASAPWLREHALSNDPVLRRRSHEIVSHFARQAADTELLAFCLNQGEDFDLEQSVLLLSRTQYPDINPEAYGALLDGFAGELRDRLDLNGDPGQILRITNEYLFRELKFTGDEHNFYDPDNSYFNRVLDRRTGNPLSLSLVYLLLARRLRLPMTIIGLPVHFLCRYQSSRAEIYVDAFRGGRLMTKADCINRVLQLRQRFDESSLAPVSSRRILGRICAHLHQIYLQRKSADQVDRLQRYIVALAK
jgi:regulator of sirC expression with transglutaminase-like and TPR domain